MCISVFGAKSLEIIFITDYQANVLLLQMLSMNLFYTFSNTVHIMLNKEPQIEKYFKIQDNTTNEMSQTNLDVSNNTLL